MKKVHLPASLQPFTQPNVCVIAKLSSGSRNSQLSLIACVGKGNAPSNVHWTHQFNWNWFLLLAGAVSLTRTRVATSKNEIFHKYFIIIWGLFHKRLSRDNCATIVQIVSVACSSWQFGRFIKHSQRQVKCDKSDRDNSAKSMTIVGQVVRQLSKRQNCRDNPDTGLGLCHISVS